MFSGSGFQSILQVLVLIVLARLLTPSDYGLLGAASVVTGISAIFGQLGVGPAIVQKQDLEPRHLRTGFTISLLLGAFLAGIICIFASPISNFFQMEGLIPLLRVMSLVLILQGACVIAQSLLQRELRFRILAGIEVFSYFLGFGIIGILLALMDFGAWALVGAQIVQGIAKYILLCKFQPHPKLPKIEPLAFRELINFGTGITIANIFNYFARNGDYLVVGRFLGAEALGLYGRAYKLMTLPATIFGNVADKVLFPTMAKIQDEATKLVSGYRRSIALIALLTIPMSVFMIILAPELISVILGKKWVDAVIPFQILSIGAMFRTSYKISEAIARSKGAVYKIASAHAFYAIFVLAGALIGQHWGISGVALGVLAALGIVFIILSLLALKVISMSLKIFLAIHLPALGLAAVLCIELYGVVTFLRYFTVSPLIILLICIIILIITLFLLLLINQKLFFGYDGIWAVHTIFSYLPKKFNVLSWVDKFKK